MNSEKMIADAVGKKEKNTRRMKRGFTVFLIIIALIVIISTIFPAITMQGDEETICGLEEHEHSAECYKKELICGLEESEEHTHSDSCYSLELICTKPEHVHSDECYPQYIETPIKDLKTGGSHFEIIRSAGAINDIKASYLIVSEDNSKALALDTNGAALHKVNISSVKEISNGYKVTDAEGNDIAAAKNDDFIKWSIVAGKDDATIRNASDGRYYINLSKSEYFMRESVAVSLDFAEDQSTCSIRQNVDGVDHYLSLTENGVVNTTDISVGNNQWIIYKLAEKQEEKLTVSPKDVTVQQTLSARTDIGTITMSGPDSSFPDGELSLEAQSLSAAKEKAARKILNDQGFSTDDTVLFDIKLLCDGKETEPKGEVVVNFANDISPLNTDENIELFNVYHIDEETDKVTQMPAELEKDGSVSMVTNHFSVYALSASPLSEKASDPINPDGNLPEPVMITVDDPTFQTPYNRLQILEVDGNARIIDMGTGVLKYLEDCDSNSALVNDDNGDPWNGGWAYLRRNAYFSFNVDGNEFGAIPIMFKGSNTSAANYNTNPDAGWNQDDMNLATTTMWVKIHYDVVGTYDGLPIGAIAEINLTPFKNRTYQNATSETISGLGNDWNWDRNNYGTYSYYPELQVSKSLYNGWVWQNVKEFHVDLTFYYLDENGNFGDPVLIEGGGDYNSPVADYYTIHSLNPGLKSTSENRNTGPEFLIPDDEDILAYSAKTSNWNSHIDNEYVDPVYGTQVAYNGQYNNWDGDYYGEGEYKDNFRQNSIMIIPQESTTTWSMTMGALMCEPMPNSVPRTESMWAAFTTDPYVATEPPPLVDISIDKQWLGNITSGDYPQSVSIEILRHLHTGSEDGPEVGEPTVFTTAILNDENNWSAEYSNQLSRDIDGHYITYSVREVPIEGFMCTYSTERTPGDGVSDDYQFELSNRRRQSEPLDIEVSKIWRNVDGSRITDTSELDNVTVKLYRKLNDDSSADTLVDTKQLGNSNNWHYIWNDLPVADGDDVEYVYSVREDAVSGYYTSIDKVVAGSDDSITVTNKKIADEGELMVRKEWKNCFGSPIPTYQIEALGNIQVKLWRHVEIIEPEMVTLIVRGGNNQLQNVQIPKGSSVSFRIRATYSSNTNARNGSISLNGSTVSSTRSSSTRTTGVQTFTVNSNTTYSYTSSNVNSWAILDYSYTAPPIADTGQAGTAGNDELVETVSLGNSNHWVYKWDNLTVNENKNEKLYRYRYFIEEINIPGFTVSYSIDNDSGVAGGEIVVTNTSDNAMDILPEAGSIGAGDYILAGTVLAVLALAVLYLGLLRSAQKKRTDRSR